jgi:hypothetical protein
MTALRAFSETCCSVDDAPYPFARIPGDIIWCKGLSRTRFCSICCRRRDGIILLACHATLSLLPFPTAVLFVFHFTMRVILESRFRWRLDPGLVDPLRGMVQGVTVRLHSLRYKNIPIRALSLSRLRCRCFNSLPTRRICVQNKLGEKAGARAMGIQRCSSHAFQSLSTL